MSPKDMLKLAKPMIGQHVQIHTTDRGVVSGKLASVTKHSLWILSGEGEGTFFRPEHLIGFQLAFEGAF